MARTSCIAHHTRWFYLRQDRAPADACQQVSGPGQGLHAPHTARPPRWPHTHYAPLFLCGHDESPLSPSPCSCISIFHQKGGLHSPQQPTLITFQFQKQWIKHTGENSGDGTLAAAKANSRSKNDPVWQWNQQRTIPLSLSCYNGTR